ncbi:MAG: hypothetical protein HKO65_18260 [Gemmatimonadetes bacterium]|nr:hypothetical protein [Gemmatimonadota bacterium]NNM07043.1 hypothetical protein [Gemmatimonadota bacterium]
MIRGTSGSFLLTLFSTILLFGCGGDGGVTGPKGNSLITLSFSGLEPLTGGLHYQAWALAGTASEPWGLPVVLFNVDESGQLVDPAADSILTGPFQAGLDPQDILGIGVSLEVSDTLLSYSSFTFILGGDAVQGSVNLDTEHWIAFDRSFTGISGRFVLATPTDEDPENELGGVWFMDTGSTPVGAGLSLPVAPEGWIYEGWVSVGDQVLSTGRFNGPTGPDSTSTFSGSIAGPSFPGEDFLTDPPGGLSFPPELVGSSLFVTVEPWMSWDVEADLPFFLRLLDTQVPADALPMTSYDLVSLEGQLPTGTATIQGS